MIESALAVTLGWVILIGLIYFTIWGLKTLVATSPRLALLYCLLLIFGLIIELASKPACACFTNDAIFINLSQWYFNILDKVVAYVIICIILLAFIQAMSEITGGRILFSEILTGFLKFKDVLFAALAMLGVKISTAIISCIICPMICGKKIDIDTSLQCFSETWAAWLSIGRH